MSLLTDNWIRLELPARPENVALVRVAVGALAAQLEFTLADLEEIRVATSEAFSNAVLHAYPPEATSPHTVTVEAAISGDTLEVRVADRGVGIADVDEARRPSFTTQPDRMGLGFVFMETFMDDLEVRTAPGSGTRVVMRRRCHRRAEADPDGRAETAGAGGAGRSGS